MNRAAIALALLVGACGSKSKEPPKADPKGSGASSTSGSGSGSGSTAPPSGPVHAAALRWTGPGGDPLLALSDQGSLEGPCGVIGGVTANDVVIDGQKFVWTGVERKGRSYQIAPLPWTIAVSAAGEVTLTNPGKPVVPLGKVTGTDTEDGAKWFAALVIAAPALQIKLGFDSTDGKVSYTLSASADLDAWTIKQATTVVAKKLRDQAHGAVATDPAPGVDAPAITVTSSAPRTFDVTITGTQTAYGAGAYHVTEAEDGALRWRPEAAKAALPLGTLTGRKQCTPHDKAVAALVETFLATKAGWTATREAEQKWFGKK